VKITRLKTAVVEGNFDWTFVRIATDEGITGLGECFFAPGLTSILRALEPLLVDEDPRDVHRLFRKLRLAASGAGSTGGIIYNAISGIEAALWDVLGQSLGVPIHRLLGGKFRNKVRLYADCHANRSDRTRRLVDRAIAEQPVVRMKPSKRKRFSPVAMGTRTFELTSISAATLSGGTGSSSHNSRNGSSSRATFMMSPGNHRQARAEYRHTRSAKSWRRGRRANYRALCRCAHDAGRATQHQQSSGNAAFGTFLRVDTEFPRAGVSWDRRAVLE